jgi:hypothetical protein
MISRLTAFAATFAVLAAATLTFATAAQQPAAGSAPQAKQVRVIQLETVTIIGHRSDLAKR